MAGVFVAAVAVLEVGPFSSLHTRRSSVFTIIRLMTVMMTVS